jgi:hypothetical protein
MYIEDPQVNRRYSTNSIFSRLTEHPAYKNDKERFLEKILPGLDGFVTLNQSNYEMTHIDNIDSTYLCEENPYDYDINRFFTNSEGKYECPQPRRKGSNKSGKLSEIFPIKFALINKEII